MRAARTVASRVCVDDEHILLRHGGNAAARHRGGSCAAHCQRRSAQRSRKAERAWRRVAAESRRRSCARARAPRAGSRSRRRGESHGAQQRRHPSLRELRGARGAHCVERRAIVRPFSTHSPARPSWALRQAWTPRARMRRRRRPLRRATASPCERARTATRPRTRLRRRRRAGRPPVALRWTCRRSCREGCAPRLDNAE